MSGIYNTVACGDLNAGKINCESQLKISTDDKVPFLITNSKEDVIFSITDTGIIFNKNDATSFLSLADTPNDYTDGILKVKDSRVIIEKPAECIKETKLEMEEIITDKLTCDNITSEICKFTEIDCNSGRIKKLEINEAAITDLQNDTITNKLLTSRQGKFNSVITTELTSNSVKCDEFITKELISGTVESVGAKFNTLLCNEIHNQSITTKTLTCDEIECPMFDVTEVKHGSLDKPLILGITQQKSIDYEKCDDMYIYMKVIKGVIKQQFKILGCPNDKLLFIKSITAVGSDIKFTYNMCLVDDEYIITFYYDKRVEVDCKLAILIN